MSILIQVTIFDEDTGAVEQQLVRTHESYYGYEIAGTFEELGKQVATILCPGWDD